MNLITADGATPLDPDTLAGLIPDLATQAELRMYLKTPPRPNTGEPEREMPSFRFPKFGVRGLRLSF